MHKSFNIIKRLDIKGNEFRKQTRNYYKDEI